MSIFSGIENVKPREANRELAPFFTAPGRVVATITAAKMGKSTNPRRTGQPFILVTFKVESVRDGDYQVGDMRTVWRPVVGEYNLRDIQGLVAAALGVPAGQVTAAICDEAFTPRGDESAPQVGCQVAVAIAANPSGATDADGNLYVNTYFAPAPTGDVQAGF